MNEDFAPISDIITMVANDQHGEATGIVNDLLSARVLGALQDHKQTIAQTLFAPSADALAEDVEQVEEGLQIFHGKEMQKKVDAAMERLNAEAKAKKAKVALSKTQQLDELSKNTLKSYVKKAVPDIHKQSTLRQVNYASGEQTKSAAGKEFYKKEFGKATRKGSNREQGVGRAVDKL